jgi:RHS repeat-associated protein
LGARFCAPEVGRFFTKDAWAGNTHKSMSLNRWTYAENNPIMYTGTLPENRTRGKVEGLWQM